MKYMILTIGLAATLAMTTTAMSQWSVDTRTSGELYGNNAPSGSIRYSAATTSMPMRSEQRYEVVRSGATPSEIRSGYNQVGPMASQGVISYLPSREPAPMPTPYAPPMRTGAAPPPPSPADPTLIAPRSLNPAPLSGEPTGGALPIGSSVHYSNAPR